MSPKMVILEVIAVLAGAVIGTLVAGFIEWLFAGTPFFTAVGALQAYVLAVVTVAIFAILYAKLDTTPAVLASLAVGVLLPTIIDRFAFGQTHGWLTLLFLNLVFAIVALSAYRFVHANGQARELADGAADRLD